MDNCPHNHREQVQYAVKVFHIKGSEHRRILDIDEDVRLHNWDRAKPQPKYETVMPPDGTPCVLVYGVLHPQIGCEEKDWNAELKKYINYAHHTIADDGKAYVSGYQDFRIFPELAAPGYGSIPCVLLLETLFDFDKEREYGFGYTTFLWHSNREYFDELLNRDYFFTLQGIGPKCDPADPNWTEHIDMERVKKSATQFF